MRNHSRRILTIMAAASMAASGAMAQSFGVSYASELCNNEPAYLKDNNITCTAVFAATNVWDFLNNLPRRITLEDLNTLNPGLGGEVTYETVIEGITFVRVR